MAPEIYQHLRDHALNQFLMIVFLYYIWLVWAYFFELWVGRSHGPLFHTLSITALLSPFLFFLNLFLFGDSEALFQASVWFDTALYFHFSCMFFYLLFIAFYSVYKKVLYALLFTLIFPVGVLFTQAYVLYKGVEAIRS